MLVHLLNLFSTVLICEAILATDEADARGRGGQHALRKPRSVDRLRAQDREQDFRLTLGILALLLRGVVLIRVRRPHSLVLEALVDVSVGRRDHVRDLQVEFVRESLPRF